MRISRDELRRQSVVSKTSLTVAGALWCATFGLLVLFDDFGAPAMLFWVCLAVCGLSFIYAAAAVLMTWAYDSGKNDTGPSAFFDGWNPLKRMVIREAVRERSES